MRKVFLLLFSGVIKEGKWTERERESCVVHRHHPFLFFIRRAGDGVMICKVAVHSSTERELPYTSGLYLLFFSPVLQSACFFFLFLFFFFLPARVLRVLPRALITITTGCAVV